MALCCHRGQRAWDSSFSGRLDGNGYCVRSMLQLLILHRNASAILLEVVQLMVKPWELVCCRQWISAAYCCQTSSLSLVVCSVGTCTQRSHALIHSSTPHLATSYLLFSTVYPVVRVLGDVDHIASVHLPLVQLRKDRFINSQLLAITNGNTGCACQRG